ncbi:MAG: 1,4-dihydroxy-6-naphthoate synthase [Myxococcales bacterium]|nr:1,4-dihydroxy-6-naphthoate synthase [Myxococcales bacterium]
MNPRTLSLAYSVDADDAFMFHAVRESLIDTHGLTFSHQRADTAALNRLAIAGGADVVAISAGVYPAVAAQYQLLPHGASVGRGFGPVVVARRPMTAGELASARVGIPGLTTTAWMVLRLIQPAAVPVEIPIAPFAGIFDALERGEIDAALLIHEGRMLYPERGLHKVVDLGEWWEAETGLPLPLGVNVIRRALGPQLVRRTSSVLRRSIVYALAHRGDLIASISAEDRGDKALADKTLIDEYLKLYANDDTANMADDARRATAVLFQLARAAGLLAHDVAVDWSD